MLIDMDDTILSAYSKPDAAWLAVAQEFAAELAPLLPTEAAAAVAAAGRQFWENAEAHWRLKLNEARHVVVTNGFATLAAAGKTAMPREFCIRMADRYSVYREEQMAAVSRRA